VVESALVEVVMETEGEEKEKLAEEKEEGAVHHPEVEEVRLLQAQDLQDVMMQERESWQ
jgi:acylphosphatase